MIISQVEGSSELSRLRRRSNKHVEEIAQHPSDSVGVALNIKHGVGSLRASAAT